MDLFFFGVYPYICLVIMTLGLGIRYVGTPGEWNARSSNLFAKKSLLTGSFIFHYAIIFVFFGHIIGLLIPLKLLEAVGFSVSVHTVVAGVAGMILAPAVLIGLGILLWRRVSNPNVWASTVPMDLVVIIFI
ncbi:MAG: respiratory nitrate reductase subunit gamma, partial [Desulfovibrio sp.]|nr:respiratory nitrate reductase subunit gamma [Desulfovibrio sp.]